MTASVFFFLEMLTSGPPIHEGDLGKLSVERECLYQSKYYKHGSSIETTEPCLNCTCNKGVLVCFLRVCHNVVAVPNSKCRVEKFPGQCCSEIVCDESSTSFVNGTTVTTDPSSTSYSDQPLDLTTEGFNEDSSPFSSPDLFINEKTLKLGCKYNDSLYAEGSAMPSSTFCEYCYCIKSKQRCIKPQCNLHIDECQPIYHKEISCCPTAYQCSKIVNYHIDDSSSTTTTGTTLSLNGGVHEGCTVNGTNYTDGESVWNDDVCRNCFCIKGEVVCSTTTCAMDMKGCQPIIQKGKCCPTGYNCTSPSVSTPPIEDQDATTSLFSIAEDFVSEYPTTNVQFQDIISVDDDVSQPRTSAQLYISPNRQDAHVAGYSTTSTRTNDRNILHDSKATQQHLQNPQKDVPSNYTLIKESHNTPSFESNDTEDTEEKEVQTLAAYFVNDDGMTEYYEDNNETTSLSSIEYGSYQELSHGNVENNPDNETNIILENKSSLGFVNQSDIETPVLIQYEATEETTVTLDNQTNYLKDIETDKEKGPNDEVGSHNITDFVHNQPVSESESQYGSLPGGDIYVQERRPSTQNYSSSNISSLEEYSYDDQRGDNVTVTLTDSEILERSDPSPNEDVNLNVTNTVSNVTKNEQKYITEESYVEVSTGNPTTAFTPSVKTPDHVASSAEPLPVGELLKSDESVYLTTILKNGVPEIPLEIMYDVINNETALEHEGNNFESSTVLHPNLLRDGHDQTTYSEDSTVDNLTSSNIFNDEYELTTTDMDTNTLTSVNYTSATDKSYSDTVTVANGNSSGPLYGSIYSIVSALLKDEANSSDISDPQSQVSSELSNSDLNVLLEDLVGEYPGEVQFNTVSYLHFNDINDVTETSNNVNTNDGVTSTPTLFLDSVTNHLQSSNISNPDTTSNHPDMHSHFATFAVESNHYTASPFYIENSFTEMFDDKMATTETDGEIFDEANIPTTISSEINQKHPSTTFSSFIQYDDLDTFESNNSSTDYNLIIDHTEVGNAEVNNSHFAQSPVNFSVNSNEEEVTPLQVESELDGTLQMLWNLSDTYASLHRPHIAWSQYGNVSNDDLLSGTIPTEVERKIIEIMRLAQAELNNNKARHPTNISNPAFEYLGEVGEGNSEDTTTHDSDVEWKAVTEIRNENGEDFESTHHEHSITDLQNIFIPLLNLSHQLSDPGTSTNASITDYAPNVTQFIPDISDEIAPNPPLTPSDTSKPHEDIATLDKYNDWLVHDYQDESVTLHPVTSPAILQNHQPVTTTLAPEELTESKSEDEHHKLQVAPTDLQLDIYSNGNDHLEEDESHVAEEYGVVDDIVDNVEPLEAEPYHSGGEFVYSHAESADEEKSYFSDHDFESESGLKDQTYDETAMDTTLPKVEENPESSFSRDENFPLDEPSVDHELEFDLTEKSNLDYGTPPNPVESYDEDASTPAQLTSSYNNQDSVIVATERPASVEEPSGSNNLNNTDDSFPHVARQTYKSILTTQNDVWSTTPSTLSSYEGSIEGTESLELWNDGEHFVIASSTLEGTSKRDVEDTTYDSSTSVNTEQGTFAADHLANGNETSEDKMTPIIELMTRGSIIFDTLLPLSRRGRPTIDENTGHALPTPRKSGPGDNISTEEGFVDSKDVQVIPFLVEDAITEDLYSVLGEETTAASLPLSATESPELPNHDTVLLSEEHNSSLIRLGASSSILVSDHQNTEKSVIEDDASSVDVAAPVTDVKATEQLTTDGHKFDSGHTPSSTETQHSEGNDSLSLSVTNWIAATPDLVTERNEDLTRVSKLHQDTVVSYDEQEFQEKTTSEAPLAITHSPPSHAFARPSLSFPEPPEYCVEHGEVFQDGERIPTHDLCAQCKCNKGEIQCQHVSCLQRPPGCTEKIILTSCCPAFVCNNTDFGPGDDDSLPVRTGITIHGGFLPIERPVVFPHNESGLHPEVPPETPAVVEFKPESSNVQHSTSWSYSDKSPFVPIDEINSPEHVSSHNIGSPGVAAFSESVAETSVPNVPDEHQPIPPVTLTERTDDTKTTLSHTSVKDDTTPLDDSNFLTDGFVGKTNSFIAETATTHSRVSSIAAAFDTDTSKDGIENRITDHEFHPTPAVYYNSPTTNVNEEIGYELSNDHQSSLGSTIHTAFPSTTLKMSPIGSANFWPSLKVSSCNIYGIMYRVGSIISVLSGPCKECRCSVNGVECYRIKCFRHL